MATIGGFGIERGTVSLRDRGIWSADIVPIGDAVLTAGQRVDIVIGDLSLSGTIADGGVLQDSGGVFVVGGAGGWRKDVGRRVYRDDAGVRLDGILKDLASETGEAVTIASSLQGALVGTTWTRPEGTAAEALDVLGKPWRVRGDGVTEIGPVVTSAASGIVALRRYEPAKRRAYVEFPDDEVASVVPGSILDLADDVSITVRDALITVTPGTIRARLVG